MMSADTYNKLRVFGAKTGQSNGKVIAYLLRDRPEFEYDPADLPPADGRIIDTE